MSAAVWVVADDIIRSVSSGMLRNGSRLATEPPLSSDAINSARPEASHTTEPGWCWASGKVDESELPGPERRVQAGGSGEAGSWGCTQLCQQGTLSPNAGRG